MINKLEITGVHLEVNDDLRKYVIKKIGKLDKYMPKHARESVHVAVKLKETKVKTRLEHTCEVVVHLPHDNLALSEKTASIYAAIDIVEEKLKAQLHKYKDMHGAPRLRQRLTARLKRNPVQPVEAEVL